MKIRERQRWTEIHGKFYLRTAWSATFAIIDGWPLSSALQITCQVLSLRCFVCLRRSNFRIFLLFMWRKIVGQVLRRWNQEINCKKGPCFFVQNGLFHLSITLYLNYVSNSPISFVQHQYLYIIEAEVRWVLYVVNQTSPPKDTYTHLSASSSTSISILLRLKFGEFCTWSIRLHHYMAPIPTYQLHLAPVSLYYWGWSSVSSARGRSDFTTTWHLYPPISFV